MKRFHLFVVLGVSLVTWSVVADSDAKKRPSQWSVDERLADRFDRAKIAERLAADRAKDPRQGLGASPNMFTYSIDGARNPELYLPHELFDALLSALRPDAAMRLRQQAFYGPVVRRFAGDEQAFWLQLEVVAQEYLILREGPQRSRKHIAICQARHRALQEMRQLFGGERFDEFLYTAIAPSKSSSATTDDREGLERRLRDEAEGCPR